jgi:TolB protein
MKATKYIQFLSRLTLLLTSLLACPMAMALDLELTQGVSRALPIAIVPFATLEFDEQASLVSEVISNDLKNSGQFRLVNFDKSHHPDSAATAKFEYWKDLGVNNVIVGKVIEEGDEQYKVHFQLLDPVSKSHVLMSKSYKVGASDLRALAHHISDVIYQKLTGERGIFSTRIAYILAKRENNKTRYQLEVADADGYAPETLLVSSQPIMSPAWSPDGKKIAYVSFENKRSQIFIVDVATGQRDLITSYPGINGAPAWSPDGKQLAVVLSKSGSPKIYLVDLQTKKLKQLTFGMGIDTEPNFSADGKSIIFTSGRGGAPQIYRLDLATDKVSRVTFEGNYNARASYTRDGRKIVMQHRKNRAFNIGILEPEKGEVRQLTFAGVDESPTIAPNGRMILYATRYKNKGVLSIVSSDGKIRMRLPSRDGEVQEPAWSPFLG